MEVFKSDQRRYSTGLTDIVDSSRLQDLVMRTRLAEAHDSKTNHYPTYPSNRLTVHSFCRPTSRSPPAIRRELLVPTPQRNCTSLKSSPVDFKDLLTPVKEEKFEYPVSVADFSPGFFYEKRPLYDELDISDCGSDDPPTVDPEQYIDLLWLSKQRKRQSRSPVRQAYDALAHLVRPNGKEFVRSKTLPSIPIYAHVPLAEPPSPWQPDESPVKKQTTLAVRAPDHLNLGGTLGAHLNLGGTLGAHLNLGAPPSRRDRLTPSPEPPITDGDHCPLVRTRSCSTERGRRRSKGNAWSKESDSESSCRDCLENQRRRSSCHTSPVDVASDQGGDNANMPSNEERRGSATSSSGRGFTRLARKLSQKEKRGQQNTENNPPNQQQQQQQQHQPRHRRQRSVSLDCEDEDEMHSRPNSRLSGDGRRANLLNQLSSARQTVEVAQGSGLIISTSPSMPGMRAGGAVSPNRRGRRRASVDVGGAMTQLIQPDKRKWERKSLSDVQALFDAVEHQDLDAVRHLVINQRVDVNCRNEHDFSPLDIAVLTNNIPVAKFLLQNGASENLTHEEETFIMTKLTTSINHAARNVVDLMANIMNSASGRTTLSGGQQREHEKLLAYWEFRHRLLKRMKIGYGEASPPDAPSNVQLTVANSSALLLTFDEPKHNGAVVSKYRVEWSQSEDFQCCEHQVVHETSSQVRVTIDGLTNGERYFVRVRAMNLKGASPYALPEPQYAVPSSWRDVEGTVPRAEGKRDVLDILFTNMRNARPADASEIRESKGESPVHARKGMKKSFKNLFTTPKFLKTMKRGVYMACLMYNEDRVLVTEDSIIPIVEVDENFTGSALHTDFHWMMKVACTWEDVKSLRQDMERNSSSSTVHFRCKLLQAAAQLQNGLGVQDLGQFYYKPIKDANGTIILTIVQQIKETKHVNTSTTKWTQITKLQKRVNVEMSENGQATAVEKITSNMQDLIHYHQSSHQSMDQGLYLGYLKLRSSVDLIQLLVPHNMPNILPHVKVRDIPNVSREEWQWLQMLSTNEVKSVPTTTQQNFQRLLVNKCDELLSKLNFSEDDCVSHRLYDLEVIELSPTVSFILLLPPVEAVCSVPGQNDQLSNMAAYLPLPVQVFEMIHMSTYQKEFISLYSRLSSILEVDQQLAQQAQREAFCSEEVAVSRGRVEQVAAFQQTLDEAWRTVRWTMDIITYSRDKAARGGLPLGILYAPPPSPECSPEMYRKDLEHVVSSASDLGYHSDLNSMTDISYDMSMNSNFLTPNYGCPSRQRAHSDLSLDNVSDFNDTTVTSGYNSQTSIEDVSSASLATPGVLRVYAAYNIALAKGTSVKLHVTPRTTAREVVQLVVQQLNRATRLKNLKGPYYCDEQLEDFCLVAVIGARERVLRPDYQPLQLQNPWTKGRLFVRVKSDLLAALDQGQVSVV